MVISTVTPQGNRIAKRFAPEEALVIYLPLDLSPILNAVIDKINPRLFIAVETEIWPGLFRELSRRRIPILIVNGRISGRSFSRYRFARPLLGAVLSGVDMFCMQAEADKDRMLALGADANRVLVTGNMKYDINPQAKEDVLKEIKAGIGAHEKVIVAGSTHPGEEEVVLSAYKRLKAKFPSLRLILAPRHIERVRSVKELIRRAGLNGEVMLIEKMGILSSVYALADVVFIGGSFIQHGGQNPIEPAQYAKPVLFGPFMFNFEDARTALLEAAGAFEVASEDELFGRIEYLLSHPDDAKAMGARAKAAMDKKRGATARNIEIIKKFL